MNIQVLPFAIAPLLPMVELGASIYFNVENRYLFRAILATEGMQSHVL